MASRRDECAEDLVFDDQGGDHQRAQIALGQSLRERIRNFTHIVLTDQLALHAARQAVAIDGNNGVLGEIESRRQIPAGRTDGVHRQRFRRGVVQADAAEIDRQVLLHAAQYDLKDALQVLPLADRAGNLLQQAQPRHLRTQASLGFLDLRKHVIEGIGEHVDLERVGGFGAHGVVVAI